MVSDFAVTRSIDGGEGLEVVPSDVHVDESEKVVTLTVDPVVATTEDQSVVYSVSYKSGTPVASEAYIVKAEEALVDAIATVNSLFKDVEAEPKELADTTDKAAIEEAGQKVSTLAPGAVKDALEALVTEANSLLSAIPSTYEFSYALPTEIAAEQDTVVTLSFNSVKVMGKDYENARFAFTTTGPEGSTVTYKATYEYIDQEGQPQTGEYTAANEGYWGPTEGFTVTAEYSADTDWTLNFSEAGEYTIIFSLIDAITEEVIDDITGSATITVAPAAGE
ncbi:Hypothetical protein DPCES_3543 [Desulfitobacterium hafniense]|uniref:Pesticidal crystal protein Cry1Aa domain-containing protein n=1 Tax=Desulfitobacterium hafniense TaxID=49338 RepID=A0A098B3K8_DESHA|nr:Hypothetical protein DPCES_3543 [Desulfitobacterium hafniense]